MTLPTKDVINSVFPCLLNIQPLKTGGQKSVFRAKSPEHGDIVVKAILPGGSDDRIKREIDIVSRNKFHNVPRIFSLICETCNGHEWLFILEQFVEGDDLRTVLSNKGKLSYSEVVELLRDLLKTTCELEKQGIVHRDIKPDNIQCAENGRYWLLDFGIARDLYQVSLTDTAAHFGPHTAGYAAPEQFRNMKKKIDSKTDLFSLGVVAYEAITGKHPFADNAVGYLDILKRTETMQVSTLSIAEDVNGDIGKFIGSLMEKYPSRRPPSAEIAQKWFIDIVGELKETGG